MAVFLLRLGGKKCKHPELMDINKYRKNNYYQDLRSEWDNMASIGESSSEKPDDESSLDEDFSQ
jgi:hypothetical protein